MDPLSQGLLGGVVAQAIADKKAVRTALVCGAIGGMAPDLDIVIRSSSDPLLSLEYHRHFTHSLAFIPFGGLLVAIGMYLLLLRRTPFKFVYLFCTLGFATHGLLDSCTTYGTLLYWPFSNERVAWDIISIIDPVFTFSLLIFVILSYYRQSNFLARTGFALSLLYLSTGYYQHEQAEAQMRAKAKKRNHKIERYQVMPTLGNLVLWRGVYEYNNRIYADAIYTSPFGHNYIIPGGSIDKLNIEWEFPDITQTQLNDIKRFTHFANGFVAMHPDEPDVIGDYRYSTLPHKIDPIWGIKIDEKSNEHVTRISFRGNRKKRMEEFWMMLDGAEESK